MINVIIDPIILSCVEKVGYYLSCHQVNYELNYCDEVQWLTNLQTNIDNMPEVDPNILRDSGLYKLKKYNYEMQLRGSEGYIYSKSLTFAKRASRPTL